MRFKSTIADGPLARLRVVSRLARWLSPILLGLACATPTGGPLDQLARPWEGSSRRATSTHRIGADGKFDPHGAFDPNSNHDNKNLPPGETRVLLDATGPGVITHLWLTFLGPEPHNWAPNGSATHQELLLRIYWDGRERPASRRRWATSSPTALANAAR